MGGGGREAERRADDRNTQRETNDFLKETFFQDVAIHRVAVVVVVYSNI